MKPKTIGIVGGMSPESTVLYYQTIVRRHFSERSDHFYPRIVLASVSFGRYIELQHAGDWAGVAAGLAGEFRAVAAAGADFALLAANTMHKVLADTNAPLPVLSVFDAAAREAKRLGCTRLGLTGTRFTMSDGFYARGLEARGLGVVLPELAEQDEIHRIIYEELIAGRLLPASRARMSEIAHSLAARGADAVLLGCTELEILMANAVLPMPVLPTAALHAGYAWEVAVGAAALPSSSF
jgi:aspartate racemase